MHKRGSRCDSASDRALSARREARRFADGVAPRRFEAEIRRLGRLGLAAAEVRRRLRPVGRELGIAVPGYTTVLELVQEVRPIAIRPPDDPGIARALLGGRAPTLGEAAATKARARVHKDELVRRLALEREERRWERARRADV